VAIACLYLMAVTNPLICAQGYWLCP
jgi:hypothetical protein